MRPQEIFKNLLKIPIKDFVLHGSPKLINKIEPKRAFLEKGGPLHNEFGIYGTTIVEIAILYALIHEDDNIWQWRIDSDSGELSVKLPNDFKSGHGWIYILQRSYFKELVGGVIYISYESISPFKKIKIPVEMMDFLQEENKLIIRSI